MQRDFNNSDFEQFLKQNADQYRMFPSDKVWDNIHNTLHTRRRWYGIGLTLLLLTTAVVTWVMLTTSERNREVASTIPATTEKQAPVTETKHIPKSLVIAPARPSGNSNGNSFITSAENLQKNLYVQGGMETVSEPGTIVTPDEIAYTTPPPARPDQPIQQPVIIRPSSPAKQLAPVRSTINSPVAIAKANNYLFVVDNNPAPNQEADKTEATLTTETTGSPTYFPLTIESVVNSYRHIQKRKKVSLEVYFSPTISYRQLRENKDFINSARNANAATNGTSPLSQPYSADVNAAVTHKPDVGLQLGFAAGYPLGKNLRLIGGLQFNISKYDIRAYNYPVELTTIALNNPNGRTSTVYTLTNYRNDGGYKANWLHNLYFSASAPIGLEYKLAGNRRNYFGVSGTVQPSFILSNRAYVLSTDYKNYAEIPSLIRKWNINTGFELFAGYTTGKVKWRIGPQVRYQVMSSFIKKYPVQEHLFDFGLKLGVMLNK